MKRIFLYVLLALALPAGVLTVGMFLQYGTSWPGIEQIIAQLKAQNIKSPESLMILSVYLFVAPFTPLAVVALILGIRPKGEYGSARWATEADIRKFKLRAKRGVILGLKGGNYIRTDEPLSTLCVAPPGAGKTSSLVIPNVLSFYGSVFALDKKGEINEKTAHVRAGFSKVFIFNPASEKNTTGFNIFAKEMLPSDWYKVEQLAYQAADLVIEKKLNQDGGENADHWVSQAKKMFVFIALLLIHKYGETSIPQVRAFALSSPSFQDTIRAVLDGNDFQIENGRIVWNGPTNSNLSILIVQLGNGFSEMAEKEFSGVFNTMTDNMSVFGDHYVAKSFSFNSFTPESLRAVNTTVYFVVDEPDVERLAPAVRLVQDYTVNSLLRREKTAADLPILFVLDEFPRFGRIPILLRLPAIGRSYGLYAMYFFQSNGQIERTYGKAGLDELDTTTSYTVLLTMNSYSTAKAYSESIGMMTRLRKGESVSNSDNFRQSKSSSKGLEGVPLVRPEDLMSLPDDEAIIIFQGSRKTPIKAKPSYWFKTASMKKAVEAGKKRG